MTVFKYAWCKIKNIAYEGNMTDTDHCSDDKLINPHIDLCNHVPSNAIRIKKGKIDDLWCRVYCEECR